MEELVLLALRAAVVDEVEVEQSVAIEVEEGGTGAHDLRHEEAVTGGDWPGIVDEVQASCLRDILEPGRVVGFGFDRGGVYSFATAHDGQHEEG